MFDLIALGLVAIVLVIVAMWAIWFLVMWLGGVAEVVSNTLDLLVPSRRARLAADRANAAEVRAWRMAHPADDSDYDL